MANSLTRCPSACQIFRDHRDRTHDPCISREFLHCILSKVQTSHHGLRTLRDPVNLCTPPSFTRSRFALGPECPQGLTCLNLSSADPSARFPSSPSASWLDPSVSRVSVHISLSEEPHPGLGKSSPLSFFSGCSGSALLCAGPLQFRQVGVTL